MSTTSLVIASLLLTIPIFISYKEHLGLEKEIIISSLRALVQLIVVGYILDIIFGFENPIFTISLVLVMIINAALNTKKRGSGIKNVVWLSFISIAVGTTIIMTVLIISGAINFKPSEVIPIAGMVISNSMVAIGLSYRNLNASFKSRRGEVEVKLSLGADVNVASKSIIRDSIKISMLPTIDSAKTLGIVALPGMMTGLILAGKSPLVAIKFQIMVTFMILSSSSIATIIATYMSYRNFFNKRKQFKI
ncbi:iron export ABC transporter permease subunit FetB [Clostridium gasigenes]|uniref:ABC transporter permease n=1 Tax=Clostridium gasigenes TaxID=94869 RepID=UPI0014384255|nr:iron export ABC transporter permease subunit FetB [Clostridium gasigenes]NKF06140.1 iron export ABC transporter permease subunit FetB [Clostridium gasigenes]QSW20030.1 iron export ABC transporter permease subunit FetB [Clostridium gasigenes]